MDLAFGANLEALSELGKTLSGFNPDRPTLAAEALGQRRNSTSGGGRRGGSSGKLSKFSSNDPGFSRKNSESSAVLDKTKANEGAEAKAVGSPPSVPAYCSRRAHANAHAAYKPSGTEMMWQKHPAKAAELHPDVGFHFQALVSRASPHLYEGAAERWPADGHATGNGTVHPLDSRKHAMWFGYRELRQKGMLTRQPVPMEGAEILEVRLDVIKQVLTSRYGGLKAAFRVLDFFQDGKLSQTEWQEGLTRAFETYTGPNTEACRKMTEHREIFRKRLREIFKEVDEDGDGLVTYDQFSASRIPTTEAPHQFTRRREAELHGAAGGPRVQAHLSKTCPAFSKQAALKADPSDRMRSFLAMLIHRFANVEEAFKVLDIHKSQQLTRKDFVAGCQRKLGYAGDANAIFDELDADDSKTVSCDELAALRAIPPPPPKPESGKKAIMSERQARSPIAFSATHKRGVSLAGSSTTPLSERMAGATGFHTFGREPTGRLDAAIHPEEFPGVDRYFFHMDTGPGHYQNDNYKFRVGDVHPLEGSKWTLGGWSSRVERFGPALPSKERDDDVELASKRYMAYPGRAPEDMYKSDGIELGVTAMNQRSLRRGPTMGSSDDPGLKGPKPIGKWGDTRTTLHLKAKSAPNLLKQVIH